jgi:CSLREA domain-containing protein
MRRAGRRLAAIRGADMPTCTTDTVRARLTVPAIATLVASASWVVVIAPGSPAAAATTIVVTTTDDVVADDGACSLREAVTAANTDTASGATPGECPAGSGSDVIELAQATYVLDGAELAVATAIRIDGDADGDGVLATIDAQSQSRVLSVTSSAALHVDGVVVTQGYASLGGGIFVDGGALTVTDSVVEFNSAGYGGGISAENAVVEITNSSITGNSADSFGGGLEVGGTVTITDSTVADNHSSVYGGGLSARGGVTVTNATFAENSALVGGAILNVLGTLDVRFSTISANSATSVPGIHTVDDPTAVTTVTASVVAGNGNGSGLDIGVAGTVDLYVSGGYNVMGTIESDVTAFAAPGDVTGVTDPKLGRLDHAGGPTATMFPADDSPVLDAIPAPLPGQPATDQRGLARTFGAGADIGAVEWACDPPPYVVGGEDGYRSALACFGSATTPGEHRIELTGDVVYRHYRPWLGNDTPDVTLVIDGNGHTIDGNGIWGSAVWIGRDTVATLRDVTITGGTGQGIGGGVYNNGTLTVSGVTITGNHGPSHAGGIFNDGTLTMVDTAIVGNTSYAGGGMFNHGDATIRSSTIADNSATGDAGGIFNSGTLLLENSTLSGNTAAGTGGALYSWQGDATIRFTTMTLNEAVVGSGIAGRGDGVSATATVTASIVAGNIGTDLDIDTYDGSVNSILSGGYNVLGELGALVDGIATTGDAVGVADPVLAPLADRGGSTTTHLPLEGSPAIGRVAVDPSSTAIDQRGVARPQFGAKDAGAVECAETVCSLGDTDGDGVLDTVDNCPSVANPAQTDTDGDSTGDACDATPNGPPPGPPTAPPTAPPAAPQALFTTAAPARFADTRPGEPTVDGQFAGAGAVIGGTSYEVRIAGRGDVPTGASAALVNLTVVGAVAPGFATVYPCTAEPPTASSVNYGAGGVDPNEVVATLSPSGSLCVFVHSEAHVLLDVSGWTTSASPYVALVPSRLADTRPGAPTVDGGFSGAGAVPAGTSYEIDVTGRAGIPSGATAAVVNLTVTGAPGAGFATVHPCRDGTPTASSANYAAGETVANELVVKLSDAGSICVFALTDTHVIADVTGYVPVDGSYTPLDPTRVADTRPGEATDDGQFAGAGRVAGGTSYEIELTGRATIPSTATAVVANLTVTGADGPGFATVHPCSPTVPMASSINFGPGTTRPNELVATLSGGGSICVFASTDVHVIIDVVGHL